MAVIFINWPWPFVQKFNSPFDISLKKIGTGVSEEKLFKGVDGQMDVGQQVITIAHLKPLAQVS